MTSVRGRGRPTRRSQASEAPTDPPSSNRDHKNLLGSNKSGSSKAPAAFKAPVRPPEASPGPPQAPPLPVLQDPVANCYSQQDLDRIIQTFLHVSKGGSGDKLKAETPDVYRSRSHMECYNFCHNVRTILPPAELSRETEFRLRPPSSGTKSTSAGSSMSGS